MISFIVGAVIGLAVGKIVWGRGKSIEIRAVDQSGSVAGGDIIGGDKEVSAIVSDIRHKTYR